MSPHPEPTTSLHLQTRLIRRKTAITTLAGTPHTYILAQPSWAASTGKHGKKRKTHHWSWMGVIYDGWNPKYDAASRVRGLIRRGWCWGGFVLRVDVASTVPAGSKGVTEKAVERLEEEARREKKRRAALFRKVCCCGCFCGKPEVEEEEVEEMDEEEGVGEQVVVRIKHWGHRKYCFELEGERYVITGTKIHASKPVRGMGVKGIALGLKIIRERDHALVASWNPSAGGDKMGIMNLYGESIDAGEHESGLEVLSKEANQSDPKLNETMGEAPQTRKEVVDGILLNALWCIVEAEHAKRMMVIDFILEVAEEVGENAGG